VWGLFDAFKGAGDHSCVCACTTPPRAIKSLCERNIFCVAERFGRVGMEDLVICQEENVLSKQEWALFYNSGEKKNC
jgi:hypothetical protein